MQHKNRLDFYAGGAGLFCMKMLLSRLFTGEIMEQIFKTQLNGKDFTITAGKIAKQASGSVIVQHGETIVLVTAVAAKSPRDSVSFLPLTVEYQEKI